MTSAAGPIAHERTCTVELQRVEGRRRGFGKAGSQSMAPITAPKSPSLCGDQMAEWNIFHSVIVPVSSWGETCWLAISKGGIYCFYSTIPVPIVLFKGLVHPKWIYLCCHSVFLIGWAWKCYFILKSSSLCSTFGCNTFVLRTKWK